MQEMYPTNATLPPATMRPLPYAFLMTQRLSWRHDVEFPVSSVALADP
jgi:hypothetical protein